MEIKYPLPPFSEASAKEKVQAAEDAWNSRDPERVSMAYTKDSEWRNRGEFINGRDNIRLFLENKWDREQDYQLQKTLWSYTGNRIAVIFIYEWHNLDGEWFRSYGNELWEFDESGLMKKRIASINDVSIDEGERQLKS